MGRGDCAAVGGTGGQEFGEQAGGNAPRRIGSARRSGSQETVKGSFRSDPCGGGSFSHQAGQGGQVEPDVGLEGEGFAPEITVDGQSLEAPPFEGGVATLGGVASAVVDAFPGWSAHGDVPYQADGAILEALLQVDELAVRTGEVGALVRRAGSSFDGSDGGSAVAAGVEAGPLVTLAVEVEAVGFEGVAEGTDGAALVVVATQGPEGSVLVGLMDAWSSNPWPS